MAGGVEGQQVGPLPGGENKGLRLVGQLPGGGLIGPQQIGPQVFGLDAEVGQGAGGLHQRPAHQGAPRQVHGQGQLGRRGLGVELPRPIHNQAAGAALQQVCLPAQAGQHAEIFEVLPRLVQGQSE